MGTDIDMLYTVFGTIGYPGSRVPRYSYFNAAVAYWFIAMVIIAFAIHGRLHSWMITPWSIRVLVVNEKT